MNFFRRLNLSLDKGLSKSVFDHVRNYMMCSLLLAIGVTAYKQDSGLIFDLIPVSYSGLSIIVLSVVLFCFNLYDGIREISRNNHHSIYTVGLILLYIIMSVGVIELASSFRASF